MTELKFTTIDVSEKSAEEIGNIIDENMAKENLIFLENKKCGYSGYVVPEKFIKMEHLLQMIEVEPMMEPLKGYAEELQKELESLKGFFSKFN
jgi:uncharacterized radical SAM superfamily Fe-S cluster-containing enzyme